MMLHYAVLTPYIAYLASAVVRDIPAADASPKRRRCVEWKFGMKILHVYYRLLTYQLHIRLPMFLAAISMLTQISPKNMPAISARPISKGNTRQRRRLARDSVLILDTQLNKASDAQVSPCHGLP